MKLDVLELEKIVQLRIEDKDMSLFDYLETELTNNSSVKFINKSMTFETPIIDYEYQGIKFSLLFDEMEDETFIAVTKSSDYRTIQKLIESIN